MHNPTGRTGIDCVDVQVGTDLAAIGQSTYVALGRLWEQNAPPVE